MAALMSSFPPNWLVRADDRLVPFVVLSVPGYWNRRGIFPLFPVPGPPWANAGKPVLL